MSSAPSPLESSSALEPSPAGRAIAIATAVVLVALLVYVATAAVDAFPALLLAAIGAVLGAGVGINTIVARDLDQRRPEVPAGWTPSAAGLPVRHPRAQRAALAAVHGAILAVAVTLQLLGLTEQGAWLAGTVVAGAAWFAAIQLAAQLAAPPERLEIAPERPIETAGPSVFATAFVAAAVALALAVLYLAVAGDSPWMPTPRLWDHYQGVLWLVLLEFVSLPLTLVAAKARL